VVEAAGSKTCLRGRQQSGPLREPATFDHPFVGSMMSPTANGSVATTTRSELTEGRRSMVSAALHDQESPPTVGSSDAGSGVATPGATELPPESMLVDGLQPTRVLGGVDVAASSGAASTLSTLEPSSSVETMTSGACYWLRGALSPAEQMQLFEFIKEHDRTDWENLPQCMNPTPKTLQLAQPGGGTGPTLEYGCHWDGSQVTTVASEVVGRVRDILHRQSLSIAGRLVPEPTAVSLAAIRYPSPDGRFPPHVDHCNDGSWVFLFSLGCFARFRLKAPAMDGFQELELQSGDALVFDPSSGAGIVHEVAGVGGEETCPAGLGDRFAELRRCRYGVQCRVRF